jgi:hypothetical protein
MLWVAALMAGGPSGCAVVGTATTAASVAYGVVSTAAEATLAVGKATVRAVGAGIGAVTPSPAANPPAAPR